MFLTTVVALAATIPGTPITEWQPVDFLRALGYERIAGGMQHPFAVVRLNNAVVYSCVKDIDGQLAGVLRTELVNQDGIYTWVSSNPKLVLRLPSLSAPEYVRSILPVGFTRDELFNGTQKLGQQLGKKIDIKGKDQVATRDCDVVSFSDRTSRIESLWLDQETGLTLKRQDRVGQDVVYERMLTKVEANPDLPTTVFTLPKDALIVKGLVSPGILNETAKSQAVFQTDLDAMRANSIVQHGGWIAHIALPDEFAYMGSSRQENDPVPLFEMPVMAMLPSTIPGNPYGSFGGGVSQQWAVPGQVVFNGGAIFFGYQAPSNEYPRDLSSQLYGTQNYNPPQQTVQAQGQVTANGTLLVPQSTPNGTVMVPQIQAGGQPPRGNVQGQTDDNSDAEAMIRSEFLNAKTGDTVTFFQLHNATPAFALRGVKLPAPKASPSPRFGEMREYEVVAPFPLHVVTWKAGGSEYVLASSSLDGSSLADIAEKAN